MNSRHIPTAPVVFLDHARQRWPGYEISGSGHIAVVYHCRHLVQLVGHVLEARQLLADRCGVACKAGNGERRWHVAYDLYNTPPEKPRASMHRLPGWDED